MKKNVLHLFALTGLMLVAAACKKDEPVPPVDTPDQFSAGTLDLGSTIDADFQGRVVDESGNPVANVLITVGSSTTSTNSNGMFILKDVDVSEKLAYVEAEKAGYFHGSRSLIPSQTGSNSVKIQLMQLNIAGTISSGLPASVTTNDGASIDFMGSYVTNGGNVYNGDVTVAAKYLPALATETSEQMPGMLYAENEAGEDGALVTYGMIVVELFGSSGQALQIAPGSIATLHMPLDPAQAGTAPATMPLWFFDEVDGYWIEQGSATLVGDEYVGNVQHFTFWNCDVFFDNCVLNGLVTDNLSNTLGSATVTIDVGTTSTTGYTNSDGTFTTYIPAGVNINVDVSYGCGGGVTSYSNGPYTANSVNNETYTASIGSVTTLTGTMLGCGGSPVADGEIWICDSYDCIAYQVTGGVVNMTIPSCFSSSVDLYMNDYTNWYGGWASMPLTLVAPLTNIDTVVVCDTSAYYYGTYDCTGEYLEVIIDGSTVINDSCVVFWYPDSTMAGGIALLSPVESDCYFYAPDASTTGVYPGTDVNGLPGEVIFYYGYDMSPITGTPPVLNFTTTISQFDGPGGMIVLTLTGTYIDVWGVSHTITANAAANIP